MTIFFDHCDDFFSKVQKVEERGEESKEEGKGQQHLVGCLVVGEQLYGVRERGRQQRIVGGREGKTEERKEKAARESKGEG